MAHYMYSNNLNFRTHKPPFAHPDLTYPERKLYAALENICREKNIAHNAGRSFRFRRYNDHYEFRSRPRQLSNVFFHDGIHLLKVHIISLNKRLFVF